MVEFNTPFSSEKEKHHSVKHGQNKGRMLGFVGDSCNCEQPTCIPLTTIVTGTKDTNAALDTQVPRDTILKQSRDKPLV